MKNAVNANRVDNPSFEVVNTASAPLSWTGVKIGSNTSLFTYPVAGVTSGKGAKVEITSYA